MEFDHKTKEDRMGLPNLNMWDTLLGAIGLCLIAILFVAIMVIL